jgi:hypothetical protein
MVMLIYVNASLVFYFFVAKLAGLLSLFSLCRLFRDSELSLTRVSFDSYLKWEMHKLSPIIIHPAPPKHHSLPAVRH